MQNAAIEDLELDYRYFAFNVPIGRLQEAIQGIQALGVAGVNVTIPHKENVMKFLDEIAESAMQIGAVNTIKNDHGRLLGRNTDGEGAIHGIKSAGWKVEQKNVVILGCGGAARAIAFFLAPETLRITIINRDRERRQKLAAELAQKFDSTIVEVPWTEEFLAREVCEADLLINTTPVGMFPNVAESPLPQEYLHENLHVFDIVYNPLETQLLKNAREVGCPTLGGIDMLVNQGAIAFTWWTGQTPNCELMKKAAIEWLGL